MRGRSRLENVFTKKVLHDRFEAFSMFERDRVLRATGVGRVPE